MATRKAKTALRQVGLLKSAGCSGSSEVPVPRWPKFIMWPRRASSPRLRLSHLGKRNYSPLPSAAAAVSWPSPKRINQTPTCVWHAPGAVQTPGKEPLFPRTPAVLLSESHLPLCFGIHGAGVCRHALLQSVGLCTGNIVTYSFFLPHYPILHSDS